MHDKLYSRIKSPLLSCLAFSVITGVFSAILVTAFKIAAEKAVHLSVTAYASVREDPKFLPLLVIGAAFLGLLASYILSYSHSCRGGGIPTSIAAIRGIVSFNWIKSILLLPISALMTFLCGVPLGTEGPCVQMGTAIGDGVIKCFGAKKHRSWRRYVMTGGAAAGFSIATSSPISAILFSMEELHKHFSPMLLTVASISVISAQITSQALAILGIGDAGLFHLPEITALAPKLLFAPLLVGIICGVCSILFTHFYNLINKMIRAVSKKLPIRALIPIIFACISIVGFFFVSALGSGHSFVDTLFDTKFAWYALIFIFLVRAVGMIVSSTAGTTGGVFLPTLAFGAIVGSLCARAMIALGWIGAEHYILMVILGITAFLGATSRIPITACVFAVEALGGINNILAVIIAATAALVVVELYGLEDFTDAILATKIHLSTKGKRSVTVEAPLTVNENSFVVGKELNDVLWPNSCVVVSFERGYKNEHKFGIAAGDVITVHYSTYDPAATAEELKLLVGEQDSIVTRIMTPLPD